MSHLGLNDRDSKLKETWVPEDGFLEQVPNSSSDIYM